MWKRNSPKNTFKLWVDERIFVWRDIYSIFSVRSIWVQFLECHFFFLFLPISNPMVTRYYILFVIVSYQNASDFRKIPFTLSVEWFKRNLEYQGGERRSSCAEIKGYYNGITCSLCLSLFIAFEYYVFEISRDLPDRILILRKWEIIRFPLIFEKFSQRRGNTTLVIPYLIKCIHLEFTRICQYFDIFPSCMPISKFHQKMTKVLDTEHLSSIICQFLYI